MTDVHIGSIRIQVEHLTAQEAAALGDRVAALLGEALSENGAVERDIGIMRTRVIAHGDGVEALAQTVVRQILAGL